jgi:uncharacterized phiE125 gp8 family phage protein
MGETISYAVKRSVQPVTEPLSLAEAKLYLRVDGCAEDALIMDMIVAVREAAENYLHKSLMTQSWILVCEKYTPSVIRLPKGPVQSISSVKTRDPNGNESVVGTGLYHLSAIEGAVHVESPILAHEIRITYACGYGDAEDVPSPVRQGMLMHLAALYEDRLGGINLPTSTIAFYRPYRNVRL